MGRTKGLLIAIMLAAILFLSQGCYWHVHDHGHHDGEHWDDHDRKGHHD